MILIYQETPSSVLKAAMLSRLSNKGISLVSSDNTNTLFTTSAANCSDYTLSSIKTSYEKTYGPLTWPDTKRGKEIATAVYYALRYKKSGSCELPIKVMSQALEFGPDFVLSRVSKEARSMFNRARRVTMEVHRAFGFVRLIPVEGSKQPVMVAFVNFEHRIHDIVLRYFSNRQKNTVIYLIDGEKAYFINGNKPRSTSLDRLPFSLPDNTFQDYWDAYYDSQFIEGRKNPALAKKHIPQKLWSWVQEGDKLKS